MRGTPEVNNPDSLVTVTLTVDQWTDVGAALVMMAGKYKTLGWTEDLERVMGTIAHVGGEVAPYLREEN